MLVPVRGDEWEHLHASGRIAPPSENGDVVDEAPTDFGIDATGVLAAMREDVR